MLAAHARHEGVDDLQTAGEAIGEFHTYACKGILHLHMKSMKHRANMSILYTHTLVHANYPHVAVMVLFPHLSLHAAVYSERLPPTGQNAGQCMHLPPKKNSSSCFILWDNSVIIRLPNSHATVMLSLPQTLTKAG